MSVVAGSAAVCSHGGGSYSSSFRARSQGAPSSRSIPVTTRGPRSNSSSGTPAVPSLAAVRSSWSSGSSNVGGGATGGGSGARSLRRSAPVLSVALHGLADECSEAQPLLIRAAATSATTARQSSGCAPLPCSSALVAAPETANAAEPATSVCAAPGGAVAAATAWAEARSCFFEEFLEHRDEVRGRFESICELGEKLRLAEVTAQGQSEQLADGLRLSLEDLDDIRRQQNTHHGRLDALDSAVAADREALSSLRRRLQQSVEESQKTRGTLEKGLRDQASRGNFLEKGVREQADKLERQREALVSAQRRGDRAVADELLSKMGELNEKLGANMQALEDELIAELRDFAQRLNSLESLGAVSSSAGIAGQGAASPIAAASVHELVPLAAASPRAELGAPGADSVATMAHDLAQEVRSRLDAECASQVELAARLGCLEARTPDEVEVVREACARDLRVGLEEVRVACDGYAAASAQKSAEGVRDWCSAELREELRKVHDECRSLAATCENVRAEARANCMSECVETLQEVRQLYGGSGQALHQETIHEVRHSFAEELRSSIQELRNSCGDLVVAAGEKSAEGIRALCSEELQAGLKDEQIVCEEVLATRMSAAIQEVRIACTEQLRDGLHDARGTCEGLVAAAVERTSADVKKACGEDLQVRLQDLRGVCVRLAADAAEEAAGALREEFDAGLREVRGECGDLVLATAEEAAKGLEDVQTTCRELIAAAIEDTLKTVSSSCGQEEIRTQLEEVRTDAEGLRQRLRSFYEEMVGMVTDCHHQACGGCSAVQQDLEAVSAEVASVGEYAQAGRVYGAALAGRLRRIERHLRLEQASDTDESGLTAEELLATTWPISPQSQASPQPKGVLSDRHEQRPGEIGKAATEICTASTVEDNSSYELVTSPTTLSEALVGFESKADCEIAAKSRDMVQLAQVSALELRLDAAHEAAQRGVQRLEQRIDAAEAELQALPRAAGDARVQQAELRVQIAELRSEFGGRLTAVEEWQVLTGRPPQKAHPPPTPEPGVDRDGTFAAELLERLAVLEQRLVAGVASVAVVTSSGDHPRPQACTGSLSDSPRPASAEPKPPAAPPNASAVEVQREDLEAVRLDFDRESGRLWGELQSLSEQLRPLQQEIAARQEEQIQPVDATLAKEIVADIARLEQDLNPVKTQLQSIEKQLQEDRETRETDVTQLEQHFQDHLQIELPQLLQHQIMQLQQHMQSELPQLLQQQMPHLQQLLQSDVQNHMQEHVQKLQDQMLPLVGQIESCREQSAAEVSKLQNQLRPLQDQVGPLRDQLAECQEAIRAAGDCSKCEKQLEVHCSDLAGLRRAVTALRDDVLKTQGAADAACAAAATRQPVDLAAANTQARAEARVEVARLLEERSGDLDELRADLHQVCGVAEHCEKLVAETQRQCRGWVDEALRKLEDLALRTRERLGAFAAELKERNSATRSSVEPPTSDDLHSQLDCVRKELRSELASMANAAAAAAATRIMADVEAAGTVVADPLRNPEKVKGALEAAEGQNSEESKAEELPSALASDVLEVQFHTADDAMDDERGTQALGLRQFAPTARRSHAPLDTGYSLASPEASEMRHPQHGGDQSAGLASELEAPELPVLEAPLERARARRESAPTRSLGVVTQAAVALRSGGAHAGAQAAQPRVAALRGNTADVLVTGGIGLPSVPTSPPSPQAAG